MMMAKKIEHAADNKKKKERDSDPFEIISCRHLCTIDSLAALYASSSTNILSPSKFIFFTNLP